MPKSSSDAKIASPFGVVRIDAVHEAQEMGTVKQLYPRPDLLRKRAEKIVVGVKNQTKVKFLEIELPPKVLERIKRAVEAERIRESDLSKILGSQD